MKKLFFLFAFMGLFAFAATAQTKACCAKKAAGEKVSCTASTADKAAAKAATSDASIVKQVSNTGDVAYTRKSVCPTSGKVSYTEVEYCTKSSKFVNVSPTENKVSCTKKVTATKVSATAKKACCAEGAKKACCSKKGGEKASNAKAENSAKVKLVSEEGQ